MAPYCRNGKLQYRTSLRDLVAGQPIPASKPLPLTHVTDSIRLDAILNDGRLRPQHCKVFDDHRLYAFYGRPAYRGSKEGPLHNLNFAPMCFIIDSSATSGWWPVEVFPFDTGALNEGILRQHVHKDLSPFDFALEPKVISAQRLAKTFFGGDKRYYEVKPVTFPTFSPTDAELVAYQSLVGRASVDERATSVELQFKDSLSIAGAVIAIILPQEFLDNAEVRKALKGKKIEPMPYVFIPDHSVKECVGNFYNLASQFYARRKSRYGWEW